MLHIVRKVGLSRNPKYEDYTYYTEQEAVEREIEYIVTPKGRKNCKEGDWVLLTDGYIAPVLNNFNGVIKIPHGCFYWNKPTDSSKALKWKDVLARKAHFTFKQRAFVECLVRKSDPFNPKQAYEAFIEAGYAENNRYYFWILFKSDKIRDKVLEHLDELFDKAGVKQESILAKQDTLTTELLRRIEEAGTQRNYVAIAQLCAHFSRLNKQMGDWAGFENRAEKEIGLAYGESFKLPETKDREEIEASYEVEEEDDVPQLKAAIN